MAEDEAALEALHWHRPRLIVLLLDASVGQALVHLGGLPLDPIVLLDLLLLSLVAMDAWGSVKTLAILQDRFSAVLGTWL